MLFVDCSENTRRELMASEPVLGKHIARIGELKRPRHSELFPALVSSIVSQLISKKAATTVYGRLVELSGGITPDSIVALTSIEIKKCGMSGRKADSIFDIATKLQSGELSFEALAEMPDREVVKVLSALPNVGEWTAQMLMIFAMGRRDVISFKDLGIRRGMMAIYGLETLNKREFDSYAAKYSPNGSAASIYLWHISDEITNTVNLAQLPE